MIIIASHFLGISRIIIVVVVILTPQNKTQATAKVYKLEQTKIRSMRRILQAGKVKSRPRPRPAMCVCVCVCVSLSLSMYIYIFLQSFFNCRIQPLSFVWTLVVMSSAEPRYRRSE